MSDRCECCDLPSYSCGKAKETELRRQWRINREQLEARGWFPANYPGTCVGCGGWFKPGTLIRMSMAPPAGWRAECCAGNQP